MFLALQQHRFPGAHLGPGRVVLAPALGQGTLQARQQRLPIGGEGVATTHATSLAGPILSCKPIGAVRFSPAAVGTGEDRTP